MSAYHQAHDLLISYIFDVNCILGLFIIRTYALHGVHKTTKKTHSIKTEE